MIDIGTGDPGVKCIHFYYNNSNIHQGPAAKIDEDIEAWALGHHHISAINNCPGFPMVNNTQSYRGSQAIFS